MKKLRGTVLFAWYLLTLRLVPVFPFFLINFGMALTPIRTWTFLRVTLLGMLPVSLVFANAGTMLASILTPALGDVPTVICGPGDPALAHKTDEYCEVAAIHEAVAIYRAILRAG